jgi:two-component system NtrC family sensor kinase
MSEPNTQGRVRRESRLRTIALVLALATLTAVVLAGVNFVQRARYVRPYDGIDWDRTADGVLARIVWQDTPGDRAGIRPGDILLTINGQAIERPIDVTKQLFRAQPGTQLTYVLKRFGHKKPVAATVVAIPQPDPFSLRGFLEFVGVLYLAIGLVVLFKRWTASHAVHFYLICLTSFIFYSFSYSGKFNNFDWAIYWSDAGARLLLPALFLHFALVFPELKPWLRRRQWLVALVYVPGGLLLVVHVVAVGAPLLPRSIELLNFFDGIEMAYLAVLFLLAAGVFEYTYRTSRDPLLTQQMKLVTRGTWLAIVPFTAFYVVPSLLSAFYIQPFAESVPNDWMKLSTLALVFIPVTFGYAVVRYRLMDVDVIFRRGVAYTLATAAIAGIYFGVAVAIAELFQTRGGLGNTGLIVALILAAILFQPIKEWTQLQLERLFYRESFDYRRTLEAFGREISGEIHLDRLMEKLLDRLGRTLLVERMAIFLVDDEEGSRFLLARGQGVGRHRQGAVLRLPAVAEAEVYNHFFVERGQSPTPFDADSQALLDECGLNYLIPCRARNRTIALLALGKAGEGRLLSSEDLELLETLTGYIAIAMENAGLYRRLEQKAEQVAQLKDFSESILESTSVGLVAVDPEGNIDSWNNSMERLTGRPRADALGRRLEELLPQALVREVEAHAGEARLSSIYKFYLTRQDGQRRVTNIALAPLVGKEGDPIGRLLIFDDITDRVGLEAQLQQAEKLTSMGLLAAGVAHEVNTPLAVISNYAQMLAKQMPSADSRAALVEKIVKQTFRASEIISSLLNFSRTGPAEFGNVDLNRILRDTLSLVGPQLKSGRVVAETDLGEPLPPIHGDVGKLQQVFVNLIFNARDAMPQGGRLRVRTCRQNSRVLVEIADNGVGIPPENLSRIYDPFFTTKATGRGTGLGLAVTYGIVQEHNGSIQVSSQPGEGTTFTLDFPISAAVPAYPADAPAGEVSPND